MSRQHRGEFTVCFRATAVLAAWALDGGYYGRKCRGITLRGDDLRAHQSLSKIRELSSRARRLQRQLFLGRRLAPVDSGTECQHGTDCGQVLARIRLAD